MATLNIGKLILSGVLGAISQKKTKKQKTPTLRRELPPELEFEPGSKEHQLFLLEQQMLEFCKLAGVRAPTNNSETRELASNVKRWVSDGKPRGGNYLPSYHHVNSPSISRTNSPVKPSCTSGSECPWNGPNQIIYAFFANYVAALYLVRNNGACQNNNYVKWVTNLALEPRKYRDNFTQLTDVKFNKLDALSQRVLTSRVNETRASFANANYYRQYAAECVRVLGLRLEIPTTRVYLANRVIDGDNTSDLRNQIIGYLNMSDHNSPLLNEI